MTSSWTQLKLCTNCSHPVESLARFCGECGATNTYQTSEIPLESAFAQAANRLRMQNPSAVPSGFGHEAQMEPQYYQQQSMSQPLPQMNPYRQQSMSQPLPQMNPYQQQQSMSQPLPQMNPYQQQQSMSQPLPQMNPYQQPQSTSQPLPQMNPYQQQSTSQPLPQMNPYQQQQSTSQPLPQMDPYQQPSSSQPLPQQVMVPNTVSYDDLKQLEAYRLSQFSGAPTEWKPTPTLGANSTAPLPPTGGAPTFAQVNNTGKDGYPAALVNEMQSLNASIVRERLFLLMHCSIFLVCNLIGFYVALTCYYGCHGDEVTKLVMAFTPLTFINAVALACLSPIKGTRREIMRLQEKKQYVQFQMEYSNLM